MKLLKDHRGAATIEFAILMIPILFCLFGLLFVGGHNLAAVALDGSVSRVASQMYEGRPFCSGTGSAEFPYDANCVREQICSTQTIPLVTRDACRTRGLVDIRRLDESGGTVIPPMLTGGAVNASAFQTSPNLNRGEVVMLRFLVPTVDFGFGNPVSGIGVRRASVLTSASAFRVRDLREFTQPTP